MQITVVGRHFDVTEPIKKHVDGKIIKLEKYADKIKEAHIMLSVEKFRHIAEITLYLKDFKLVATEESRDMYASIDKALDNLHRQLLKLRDRVKEHRGRRVARKSLMLGAFFKKVASRISGRETKPRVIEMPLQTKPMSVDEACAELEVFKENFIVFRNAQTDKINVVFKRKDGDYGFIAPE